MYSFEPFVLCATPDRQKSTNSFQTRTLNIPRGRICNDCPVIIEHSRMFSNILEGIADVNIAPLACTYVINMINVRMLYLRRYACIDSLM